MTLQQIETIVLSLIGYDRYADLSVSTDTEKVADFALLHNCVTLAREEIKLNTKFPAIVTIGTGITVTADNTTYSLPTDFDIPVIMYYWQTGNSSVNKLQQIYIENPPDDIPIAIGNATMPGGMPTQYMLADTASDQIQIHLYPVPQVGGIILPIYKPVLTELTTSTDEDIIMTKYPKAVIDFATAFAFQIIKKDATAHDKYYTLGMTECEKIDLREKAGDSSYRDMPDYIIRNRRAGRLSR